VYFGDFAIVVISVSGVGRAGCAAHHETIHWLDIVNSCQRFSCILFFKRDGPYPEIRADGKHTVAVTAQDLPLLAVWQRI
jgi:hypothetical protein